MAGKKPLIFEKPWLEFLIAVIAIVCVLLIGQLYIYNLLIPRIYGFSVLIDALNQTLIFSPIVISVLFRKQSFETCWLKSERLWLRIVIGIGLGIFALSVYSGITSSFQNLFQNYSQVYQPENFSHLVQVFWEDLTIAFLFVRLKKLISTKASIILVPVLFAAAHIPSLLSQGIELKEMVSLVLDALLGFMLIFVLNESGDIIWFVPVHFAMDMSQFLN